MKQIVPSLAETQVKGTHSLQKLSNLFGKIKTFIMALKKKTCFNTYIYNAIEFTFHS